MKRKGGFIGFVFLVIVCAWGVFISAALGAAPETRDDLSFSIYFRPGVRFGSDDRTISTFDFLIPFYRGEKNILFFNPRYSLDNRDGSEMNLGVGYRHLLLDDKLILGINGYYDCRWTGWGTRHEQAGAGLEVMTDWVTGRFNGYFPVTGPQIGPMSGPTGYYFRDVGIYLGAGSLEETLGGFDGELGFKIPYLSKYLETWVYAGGYHFEGDYTRDVNGFSSRVEVVPTDFLRLGFEYRNDTMNGDQYFGEAAVTVPFSIENLVKGKNPFEGIGKHFGTDRTLKDRLTEPVRRDVDVRMHNAGVGPALPGTETLVEGVVFVSEGAADGAGNGTYENPFATVGEAAVAIGSGGIYSGITVIHVMNDTASETVYGGTVDVAGLWIWGSGMPNPTYGYITNQYLGNPDIYELNITADNVEIFGDSFMGTTTGMTTSGSGTYVHDNYFTAATGLSVAGGSSVITNNIFSGTYGVYTDGGTSTVTGNTFGGMYGAYTAGGTANISDNIFSSGYGVYTTGGTSTIDANTFTGTYGVYTTGGLATVTGNTFGGTYGAYTAGGTANISDNIFSSGYGVYTTGGTSTIDANTFTGTYGVYGTGGTVSVTDNDFFGNTCGIYTNGGSFTITGNTLGTIDNPITYAGIYLGELLGAHTITGNMIVVNNAGSDTYGIESHVANLILGSNDISVASGSGWTATGIYAYSNLDDLTGSISGGTITASGTIAYGIYLEANYGSIGNSGSPFTISGVTIDVNGTDGAQGLALTAGGDIYSSIVGTDITGTSAVWVGHGIYEYAGGSLFGSISGGTVTVQGPGTMGIYLEARDGSIGSSSNPFTIWGLTIDATGTTGSAYGIYERAHTDIFGTISGGSITADGPTACGVWLGTNNGSIGGSSSPFTISGATISASGTNDTYGLYLSTGGDLYGSVIDSNISGTSTGGAVYGIYEYASSIINGSITGGTITAGGIDAYGIYLRTYYGSIGSTTSPFAISGVTIGATGTGAAYGIREYTQEDSLFGSISGGSITASGNTAYGTWLEAHSGSIGGVSNPFTISGVTVDVNGTDGAQGLALMAGGDIYSSIMGTDITGTSDLWVGYGIYEYAGGSLFGGISDGTITIEGPGTMGVYLEADGGAIGGSTSPFAISGLTIDVTGTTGAAYGIYGLAHTDIYGSISGGSITASGPTACGVWLGTNNGSIGGSSSPFAISGLTIDASGTNEAYGLYLSAVNLYGSISNSLITGTSTGGAGYGIYGHGLSGIYGSISGGSITAGGTTAYGAFLTTDSGPIGGASNLFSVSGVTIDVTGQDGVGGLVLTAAGDIYSSIFTIDVTGTSASGAGYGIYEYAGGSLFGGISTGTVTADGVSAMGVYLEAGGGSIGSSTNPFIISGLMIDATGTTGSAYGIYGRASNNLFGSILGGSITAGGANAYGAYLEAAGGSIGSFASPFTVSGATIDASGFGDTYGLCLTTGGDLYGSVIDNDITGTSVAGIGYGIYEYASSVINGSITGGAITAEGDTQAYGIYLRTYYGSIGSTTNPFTISGVTVNAAGTRGDAYGIWEYSREGDVYGLISGGSITATGNTAYGAYVYSYDGGIGSAGSPFTVSDVSINATGTGGDAYGIWEYTNAGGLYDWITGGSITATGNNAYGVYINTYSGSIGASGSPFTVSGVTINATGIGGDAYGTYMIGHYLYGSITGGSIIARGSDAYGVFFSGVDIGDATNPLMISDVTIDATGTDGDAYGIYFVGGLHVYGSITGANVTATGENAYGIYTENSWLMALSSTLAVSDTVIDATGTNGDAYGIYEEGRILAGSITGGSITASGHNAYGAYLWTASDSIGSSTGPFTVSGATINATGTSGTAFGIGLESSGSLYALVEDAIVNASGTGDTWGLLLTAAIDLDADIGGSSAITGTSTGGVGCGIYGNAGGSLTGSITGSSITANGNTAYGVLLEAVNGSIGLASDPFTLSGATITATGDTYARGLYLNAADSLNLEISGGLVSATGNDGSARGIYGSAISDITFSIVNGRIEATGTSGTVYGIGLAAGGGLYGSIVNSDITGMSGSGIGYGIYEYASSIISGSITGGTITARGTTDAYGARIYSLGDIGASGSPFAVSGVTIDAAGTGYDFENHTSGLYLEAKGGLYSSVIDSDITATSLNVIAHGIYEYASSVIDGSITGGTITAAGFCNAYGVYLGSNSGSIGSAANPFTISGATIDVTGTGGWYAYGIYSRSDAGTTYTLFADNTITTTAADGAAIGVREFGSYVYGGISGGSITSIGYCVEGIELIAGAEVGSSASPFSILGVSIDVTGTGSSACGIYEYATGSGNLFGSITDDSITVNSLDNATGIYLSTSSGSIGGSTSPFTISGTTIGASGAYDTYGLYLTTGGTIYSSVVDSDITGTSSWGTGYGIYEFASLALGGSITGGTITANGRNAYGAYLEAGSGPIGSSTRPFTVSDVTIDASGTNNTYSLYLTTGGTIYSSVIDSDITGTSSWGTAYGIYEYASSVIDGSIMGGTITATGRDDAYGVYLETYSGSIGSTASPFEISGVTINATGPRGVAYGIWEYTEDGGIYGSITGGSITTSALFTSMGIDIVGGSIGSSANPFTVSGVTIDATATSSGGTCGIRSETSVGDLYALFENNIIAGTAVNGGATGIYGYAANIIYGEVSGGSITSDAISAFGINLRGQYSIGALGSPFVISGVTIDAAGTGSAYGIYEYSQYGGLFGSVLGGSITAGNAATYAYGVYLNSGYGYIGNAADPFAISDITIGVTGSVERYLLYLYSRLAGSGNEVDWSTITYDGSGSWTGNYLDASTTPLDLSILPVGTTLPVWTNFLTGDTITP